MAAVRSDYERVLRQRARAAEVGRCGAARRGLATSSGVARTRSTSGTRHLADHGGELLRPGWPPSTTLRPHAVAAYAQVAPASAELHAALRERARATCVPALADDLVPDREACGPRCSRNWPGAARPSSSAA